jgi:hypothetical protein
MASFVTPGNGEDALAEHIAQLTENFGGLRNIPVSISGINDAAAHALTLKNAGTGSKALLIYAADGSTVLFRVDGAGVVASRAGGAAERVLTTGETGSLTAAMHQAEAWTAFSPTVGQSGAVTVTTNYAAYQIVGKRVMCMFSLTASSVGNGGDITVTIPAAIQSKRTGNFAVLGSGIVVDNGTGNYACQVVATAATTLKFLRDTTGYVGSSPTFTVASGDSFQAMLAYELA